MANIKNSAEQVAEEVIESADAVIEKAVDAVKCSIEDLFEEVELVGEGVELVGSHTIYMRKLTPIEFKDGKAKVLHATAKILRKEGLVK